MSKRPTVAPHVVAAITESAPDRVRRKLDRNPDAASDWKWEVSGATWSVAAGNETVKFETIDGVIGGETDVSCSCLLSPRCFHLMACLSTLEFSAAEASSAREVDVEQCDPESALEAAGGESANKDESDSTAIELTESQRTAASQAWQESAELLALGARSAGALTQAKLLRAIHECRSVGLHRLSNAGLRVINGSRQLRGNDDEFDSDEFMTDIADLFEVAWRLQTSGANIENEWIGTARRPYFSVESLRLQTLFTEPILTSTGHAGVVSYLMDSQRQVYSISNVRTGEPSRVIDAWDNGIDLGGLSVSHRELSRKGMLIQTGTSSNDGRLGSGKGVKAITTKGDGWNARCIEESFAIDFDEQVTRVFAASGQSLANRRAGWDLVFVTGIILGTNNSEVVLQMPSGSVLRLGVAIDHDKLAFLENMTLLARSPGLAIQCIGRIQTSDAGRIDALAIAPIDPGARDRDASDTPKTKTKRTKKKTAKKAKLKSDPKLPTLTLERNQVGHINLGLELLARHQFSVTSRHPVVIPITASRSDDGLTALRRRLRAMALHGRHSLPTGKVNAVTTEVARLKETQPTAAALLQSLGASAVDSSNDITGLRFPADAKPLAQLWLATSNYTRAATQSFEQSEWSEFGSVD